MKGVLQKHSGRPLDQGRPQLGLASLFDGSHKSQKQEYFSFLGERIDSTPYAWGWSRLVRVSSLSEGVEISEGRTRWSSSRGIFSFWWDSLGSVPIALVIHGLRKDFLVTGAEHFLALLLVDKANTKQYSVFVVTTLTARRL